MAGLTDQSLKQLQGFIGLLKSNPDLLHDSKLAFFAEYIKSLGAQIPAKKAAAKPAANEFDDMPPLEEVNVGKSAPPKSAPAAKEEKKPPPKATVVDDDEMPPLEEVPSTKGASKPAAAPAPEHKAEEIESEEEKEEPAQPDSTLWPEDDVKEAEKIAPFGDESKEPQGDDEDDAFGLMSEARGAAKKGDHAKAIEKLSEAIKKCPKNPIFYATRAEVFLEMKKPRAAIRDASKAISLNPDSAKALKARGKALRFLGNYEEGLNDMMNGNKVDWDEATGNLIKEIQPRVTIAQQKRRVRDEKKEKKEREKKLKDRQRAQEEARSKYEAQKSAAADDEMDLDDDEGMPGMGGGGGGGRAMPPGMAEAMADPEVQAALRDPAVMAKLQEGLSNPAKLASLMSDPKLARVFQKLFGGMGGGGGMPFGGAPGGFGGPPGGGFGGRGGDAGAEGGFGNGPDDDLD